MTYRRRLQARPEGIRNHVSEPVQQISGKHLIKQIVDDLLLKGFLPDRRKGAAAVAPLVSTDIIIVCVLPADPGMPSDISATQAAGAFSGQNERIGLFFIMAGSFLPELLADLPGVAVNDYRQTVGYADPVKVIGSDTRLIMH